MAQHAPPYIVKPSFGGRGDVDLDEKNRTVSTREQFWQFLNGRKGTGLLTQRLLKGGDGEIYDTYGYCDAQGQVRTICTHRRLRQNPPHFGTTTYGEIPSRRDPADDVIIAHTLKLLAHAGYQGIFGIEWLRDTSTGHFYLIDFNARPELPHKLWVNLIRDLQSRRAQAKAERVPLRVWLLSVLQAEGHAYMDWHDLLPALQKAWELLPNLLRVLVQG